MFFSEQTVKGANIDKVVEIQSIADECCRASELVAPFDTDDDVSKFKGAPPYPPDPNSTLHRRPPNIIRTYKYERIPPYTPTSIQQYINMNINISNVVGHSVGHALG